MNSLEPPETHADVTAHSAGSTPLPGLRPAKSRLVALCIALATVFVLGFSYGLVNELSAARGVTVFDPEQLFLFGDRSLDSRIPYLPWTLRIYLSLFIVYLLPVVTYPKTETGASELLELYWGLIVITLVACVIFVLCPAEISRQAVRDHKGLSEVHAGVLGMHAMSPPFNTWPSLHVAQSGLIFLMLARWLARRHWGVLFCGAWVGLSVSTLTIKEHFIWDVMTGSLLALGYWHWRLKTPINGAAVNGNPALSQ